MAKMLERLFFEKSYNVELLWKSRDEIRGSLNAVKLKRNFINVHSSKGKTALNQETGPSLSNRNNGQSNLGEENVLIVI